jgi:hypothetical protein
MSSRMQMERWHGDVVTGCDRLRLEDVAPRYVTHVDIMHKEAVTGVFT